MRGTLPPTPAPHSWRPFGLTFANANRRRASRLGGLDLGHRQTSGRETFFYLLIASPLSLDNTNRVEEWSVYLIYVGAYKKKKPGFIIGI